jgi:hypothetical protein
MPATTFIGAKIASACGGLFGGLAVMAYMKPISILDASIRGGISTGAAIIGATLLMDIAHWPDIIEYHAIAGAVIGFSAWSVLGAFARVFIKVEKNKLDAIEVVSAMNNLDEALKPVTKVRRKRAVKKY